jgi:heme exporter protein A
VATAAADGDENRSGRKICFLTRECGFDSRRPHQMNALKANGLHLWRGERHVLRGISFELQAGQCLQVQGANGAGKTTLLRALCGLLPLEEGSVDWCGRPVQSDWLAFRGALAWASHQGGLKGDLTPVENLCCLARMAGAHIPGELRPAARDCLQRAGLPAACAQQPVRQLSAGQQRRVTLARVLLMRRALWLLDEPTSNLDTDGQALVSELLRTHLCAGGLAVVATHQPLQLATGQWQALELQ